LGWFGSIEVILLFDMLRVIGPTAEIPSPG